MMLTTCFRSWSQPVKQQEMMLTTLVSDAPFQAPSKSGKANYVINTLVYHGKSSQASGINLLVDA